MRPHTELGRRTCRRLDVNFAVRRDQVRLTGNLERVRRGLIQHQHAHIAVGQQARRRIRFNRKRLVTHKRGQSCRNRCCRRTRYDFIARRRNLDCNIFGDSARKVGIEELLASLFLLICGGVKVGSRQHGCIYRLLQRCLNILGSRIVDAQSRSNGHTKKHETKRHRDSSVHIATQRFYSAPGDAESAHQ